MIFGGMIVAASSGLANILVCALAAAFLMIVCKCLPLRDAYRAIESRVLYDNHWYDRLERSPGKNRGIPTVCAGCF